MNRKRMIGALILLIFLLTGCAEDKSSGHSLQLFYPAAEYEAGGDVILSRAVDWSMQQGGSAQRQVEQVVSLVQNRGGEMDFTSPIPQDAELLECTISGGVAVLDFSAAYGRLSGLDLTVADYCLTLSAAQIPGVHRVQILVEGEVLPAHGESTLSTEDVLLTSSEDVVKLVAVTLYFPDGDGSLQPEKRELLIYEGENRPQRVIQELASGPTEDGLNALLPDDLEVAGVWMDGDVCCLNLSLNAYRKLCAAEVNQEQVVRGLVQSVCSLSGVNSLQFLVNGSYRNMMGAVNIYMPITP